MREVKQGLIKIAQLRIHECLIFHQPALGLPARRQLRQANDGLHQHPAMRLLASVRSGI